MSLWANFGLIVCFPQAWLCKKNQQVKYVCSTATAKCVNRCTLSPSLCELCSCPTTRKGWGPSLPPEWVLQETFAWQGLFWILLITADLVEYQPYQHCPHTAAQAWRTASYRWGRWPGSGCIHPGLKQRPASVDTQPRLFASTWHVCSLLGSAVQFSSAFFMCP